MPCSVQREFVVADGNAPWVRSLLTAMPLGVCTKFLRVTNPGMYRRMSNRPLRLNRSWDVGEGQTFERWMLIPGWGRVPAISTWLVQRAMRKAADINRSANVAMVFTLPQYAGVAEQLPASLRIYYAHDPFEFYDWDRKKTREQEDRMLAACDVTFAISRRLRDDLAARTDRPVIYSPNAVATSFVNAFCGPAPAVPADIAAVTGAVVGCVGQINNTYDWPMLDELTAALPGVTFVFIGPLMEEDPARHAAIERVLSGRPNVRWLGPKPHVDLPGYMSRFDVCLSALAPGPHADRRSPLRFYDYLATGKPVVSTDVAEAHAHDGHVWVGQTAPEIAAIIGDILAGHRPVDLPARRRYVQANTWSARAATLLKHLESIMRGANS